jgi:hypothetical protein
VATNVERLREIHQTIDPKTGTSAERRLRFDALAANLSQGTDAHQHMARTMASFVAGLFAGGDDLDLPSDNLALERAFRLPKAHERRIHGHAHAGVRIVQRGPSLLPVLDAHARHPAAFRHDELSPWLRAEAPAGQRACMQRRGIMRRARSTKKRPLLLAELERRYREALPAS